VLLPVSLDFVADPGQVEVAVFGIFFTHCKSFPAAGEESGG
jgi:hypothetical protein